MKGRLTVYDRELIGYVAGKFDGVSAGDLVARLIEMGVVDTVKCKVLVVRRFVDDLVRKGEGKVAAMYTAADRFCCSYEYVRKCMYYYKDVNLV